MCSDFPRRRRRRRSLRSLRTPLGGGITPNDSTSGHCQNRFTRATLAISSITAVSGVCGARPVFEIVFFILADLHIERRTVWSRVNNMRYPAIRGMVTFQRVLTLYMLVKLSATASIHGVASDDANTFNKMYGQQPPQQQFLPPGNFNYLIDFFFDNLRFVYLIEYITQYR